MWNQCFPIPYNLNEGLGSTLAKIVHYNHPWWLAHCNIWPKVASKIILVVKRSFLVAVFGQWTTKTLWLTSGMIYLCTFLLCVAMARSQWKVVMNRFSRGRRPNLALNNFPNSFTSFVLSLFQGTFIFVSMHANPFFPNNFQESLNNNNHWSDEAVYGWCQAYFYPNMKKFISKWSFHPKTMVLKYFKQFHPWKIMEHFLLFFRYRKYYSLVVKKIHNAAINWMDFVKGLIFFLIDLWHGESC